MQYTLEVCVDSLESAITAVESGSDRIELCSSLETGGITPSYALIQHVCRRINDKCKIHVLVRPRAGDFVYSEDEIEIITADVVAIKNLGGAHGIVAGFLQPDGTIDTNLTTKFADLCTALSKITFFISPPPHYPPSLIPLSFLSLQI
jgi:copper homeostasis protein